MVGTPVLAAGARSPSEPSLCLLLAVQVDFLGSFQVPSQETILELELDRKGHNHSFV